MKKLPIGIQTFSEIIQDDYAYVDKTYFAHKLISRGKYYFMSRPDGLGKVCSWIRCLRFLRETRNSLRGFLSLTDMISRHIR